MRTADAHVDCGSCTACCRQLVVLSVEDDPSLYETIEIPMVSPLDGSFPTYAFKMTEEGACPYLGAQGCTIYDKRPKVCRVFSCVGWVAVIKATMTRQMRRREMGKTIDAEIWQAGIERTPK